MLPDSNRLSFAFPNFQFSERPVSKNCAIITGTVGHVHIVYKEVYN